MFRQQRDQAMFRDIGQPAKRLDFAPTQRDSTCPSSPPPLACNTKTPLKVLATLPKPANTFPCTTGWLYEGGVKGAKFDSSKDRGQPFEFPWQPGHVIRGWDEGVQGMKVGGTRILVIPPQLGYGARGAGGVIPQRHIDVREVDLLGV